MTSLSVNFANVPGTEAALGWAGAHTLIADRRSGTAGGMGLGFNGGELLALAIGGCFCNDLRYVAHDIGVGLARIEVQVTLDIDGTPPFVTAARVAVMCETDDGSDATAVIDRAKANSTISNSISRGIPVAIEAL